MPVEIEGAEGIQYIAPDFITEEDRNNNTTTNKEENSPAQGNFQTRF